MTEMTHSAWQREPGSNEIRLALPHITLGGRLWGSDDKPLLLALHGWLDNANSFEPLVKHLSDYQVLAIDWPGHGLSAHRPGQYPLHWVDYLYDLEMLITHLSRDKAIHCVIGHSLGGIVASAYSAAFAEKASYWVFIEALCPLFESSAKSRQRLVKSFSGHQRLSSSTARGDKALVLDAAVSARQRLTGLDEQWCRLLLKRNVHQVDGKLYWRSDPRLKLDSPMRLNFDHVDGLMQGHRATALVITGRQGYPISQEMAGKAQAWYHDLQHVELEGDHHLHMGNSSDVAKTIKQFIS